MRRVPFLLALLLLAIVSLSSQRASALPAGWTTSTYSGSWGSWTLINDTTHGLDWLSPDYSNNISYDSMVLNLSNPASPYHGFRYASRDEVTTLFSGYGVTTFNSWINPNYDLAVAFEADFGTNGQGSSSSPGLWGFSDTAMTAGQNYTPHVQIEKSWSPRLGYFGNTGNSNRAWAGSSMGSWLIVTTVPEPSTMLSLLIGAFTCLAALRRSDNESLAIGR